METKEKNIQTQNTKLPEQNHSHIEVISSVLFVVLVVIGMYLLSGHMG